MRLAYLSQDRSDLLVLGKELAKGLKRPTVANFQMLKRGVRYLRANPRLVHVFPNQTQFTNLELWVDADHAGLHSFPQVNNWYSVAARQMYDSHNMQIASSYCFEFRRS